MDPLTFLWLIVAILVVVLSPLVFWSLSVEKSVTKYIPIEVQMSGAPIGFMFRHHVKKLIRQELLIKLPSIVPTVFTESGLEFYVEDKKYFVDFSALDDVRWYSQTARIWFNSQMPNMTRSEPLVVWIQGHSQELILKKWDDYSQSLKPLQYFETELIDEITTRFRTQRRKANEPNGSPPTQSP